jgi:myo-inositol 2-dehydrogenase/D-chiro-inositol 1-dehydrogenase
MRVRNALGESKVLIGVIGVGRIGRSHAETLKAVSEVDEIIVADIDLDRAQTAAAELDVTWCKGNGELIEKVDAVVIAAATTAHADLIIEATSAGKPTFCEKPISIDLESTQRVVDHVHTTGAVVQVGFQRRFDAGYLAARDLVASGGIGTLYAVRMAGHDPAPPHESYIRDSGGLFRDFSIHDFDALRFVTGQEIVEVYADGDVLGFPIFREYDDIDTGFAILRLESGARGILSVTRHDPLGYDIRMELLGSGDSAVVGWDDRLPLRSLEPGGPAAPINGYKNFQERFQTAFHAELEAFCEVAGGKADSPCTVDDAQKALRVAVACDLSLAEKRPVLLTEVG